MVKFTYSLLEVVGARFTDSTTSEDCLLLVGSRSFDRMKVGQGILQGQEKACRDLYLSPRLSGNLCAQRHVGI